MTDDRRIKDTIHSDKSYHLRMADKFISKLQEKVKQSGTTRADEARLYAKMKQIDEIKKKITNGSLSEAHAI